MPTERTWIVDRFEGDRAVVETEDRTTLELPRRLLPEGTEEGDVLRVSGSPERADASAAIRRDVEATAERGERLREQVKRLRRRDRGGDIEL